MYVHTHLHTHMCCHRCRFPCAPGLSDGVLLLYETQVPLEQTHIFSSWCAQYLRRSKLREERLIFGFLFEDLQSGASWQEFW